MPSCALEIGTRKRSTRCESETCRGWESLVSTPFSFFLRFVFKESRGCQDSAFDDGLAR